MSGRSKQSTLFQTWGCDKERSSLPEVTKKPFLPKPGLSTKLDANLGVDDFDLDLLDAVDNAEKASYLDSEFQSSLSPEVIDGFDESSAKTYIYPTNYPTRKYQFDIIKAAMLKNTLVVLPTGLGKTFIASVVMYNFYRWYPQGKIIFMAPTRPLVAQQIRACYEIMGIPYDHTAEITGSLPPAKRQGIWASKRVFFCTPQVLQNDLERGIVGVDKIVCIVVDEAHKALGNHAYCQVTKEIFSYTHHFRVLALSATPGGDCNVIQDVMTSLMISHIEVRSDDSADVKPYTHGKNIEKIVVKLNDEMKKINEEFTTVLEGVVKRLYQNKAIWIENVTRITKFVLLKAREKFRLTQCPNKSLVSQIEGDFASAMSLYHAHELIPQHGLISFYNFLTSVINGDKGSSRAKGELKRNQSFMELLNDLGERIAESSLQNENATTSYDNEKPADSKFVSHPKITKLEEIVVSHFQTKNQSSGNGIQKSSSRIIVFSQYRDSVQEITKVLNRHNPLVNVMSFVGQSTTSKACKGLTQKQQIEIITKFRSGHYNTLVSTSVGEEGLDIGEVDLIVCFDATNSPISLVQRMGRTGRKRTGKVIVLVTEGKEDQSYGKSLINKTSVQKSLSNHAKSLTFYKSAPRMIPKHINPVCHKIEIRPALPTNEKSSASSKKKITKKKEKKQSSMDDVFDKGNNSSDNMDNTKEGDLIKRLSKQKSKVTKEKESKVKKKPIKNKRDVSLIELSGDSDDDFIPLEKSITRTSTKSESSEEDFPAFSLAERMKEKRERNNVTDNKNPKPAVENVLIQSVEEEAVLDKNSDADLHDSSLDAFDEALANCSGISLFSNLSSLSLPEDNIAEEKEDEVNREIVTNDQLKGNHPMIDANKELHKLADDFDDKEAIDSLLYGLEDDNELMAQLDNFIPSDYNDNNSPPIVSQQVPHNMLNDGFKLPNRLQSTPKSKSYLPISPEKGHLFSKCDSSDIDTKDDVVDLNQSKESDSEDEMFTKPLKRKFKKNARIISTQLPMSHEKTVSSDEEINAVKDCSIEVPRKVGLKRKRRKKDTIKESKKAAIDRKHMRTYFDDEAEESDVDMLEVNEEDGEELDPNAYIMDSFIDDGTQITPQKPIRNTGNHNESPADMMLVYKQSLLSPNHGKFKFASPKYNSKRNRYKMVHDKHEITNSDSEAEEVMGLIDSDNDWIDDGEEATASSIHEISHEIAQNENTITTVDQQFGIPDHPVFDFGLGLDPSDCDIAMYLNKQNQTSIKSKTQTTAPQTSASNHSHPVIRTPSCSTSNQSSSRTDQTRNVAAVAPFVDNKIKETLVLADSKSVANSQICTYLRSKHGIRLEIQQHLSCDFLVRQNTAVLRKNYSDLSSGKSSSNLCGAIKTVFSRHQNIIMIAEKDRVKKDNNADTQGLNKNLTRILSHGIFASVKFLFSESQEETALLVASLAKNSNSRDPRLIFPRTKSKGFDEMLKILLCIPSIGHGTALKICSEFPSFGSLCKSSSSQLKQKLQNVPKIQLKAIYSFLRTSFMNNSNT